MQFTVRSQQYEFTWTDGVLTGPDSSLRLLRTEASLREKYGPPVELPTLHFIHSDILSNPLGALGLLQELFGPCEISGDVPIYQDDEDPENTVY